MDGYVPDHISGGFMTEQAALRGLTGESPSERVSHGGRKEDDIVR